MWPVCRATSARAKPNPCRGNVLQQREKEPVTDMYLRHIRNATCTLAVIAVLSVVLGIIGAFVITSRLGDVVQCISTETSAGCTP